MHNRDTIILDGKRLISRRSLIKGFPALLLARKSLAQLSINPFNFGLPISFASLGTNIGDTANVASYATSAAYTPTANALVIAAVANSKASAPNTPTFSGNGLTWVQIGTQTYGTIATPLLRLTLFRAMGASPTNTTGVADFAAVAQTGCSIRVVEFRNVDRSGTNGSGAVVQAPTFTARDSGTNPTFSLAAISNPRNATFGAIANNQSSETSYTAETLAVEIAEDGYVTPSQDLMTFYRLGTEDNSLAVTGASVASCFAGIEIKALT